MLGLLGEIKNEYLKDVVVEEKYRRKSSTYGRW